MAGDRGADPGPANVTPGADDHAQHASPTVLCPQGHVNAWDYRFCERCGSPIGVVPWPSEESGTRQTGLSSEVPAPDYDVVVFENRFPSLAGAGIAPIGAPDGDGFVSAPGHGRHYRAASYLVAGAVELALIGLLVVTGQTLMAISVAFLVALGGPLVVVNHRRAERSRG